MKELKSSLRRFLSLNRRFSRKREKFTQGIPVAAEKVQVRRDAAGNDKPPPRVPEITVDGQMFWPRDLLPKDVKDARVLTFGYYSSPGVHSQDNLHSLGERLLGQLANERSCAVCYPACL